ncbi:MAG: GNAT family N-acetyltransferase [Saprospiraceae bacterium]|jgi:GNAT superfamily N-acetyltransferase|nr:GNAT family N-acetyltransferase [Saprospiraceae bacterium]
MHISVQLKSGEKILIRTGSKEDLKSVFSLVNILAEFEKAADAVKTSPEIYLRDFEAGWFEIIIAESEDTGIIGMALFYQSYSTWKGKMIYLDDLVVEPDYRSKGIGSLILDALIEESRLRAASLLKWQVLDWNEDAIRFYKRKDAIIEDDWLNCKLFL